MFFTGESVKSVEPTYNLGGGSRAMQCRRWCQRCKCTRLDIGRSFFYVAIFMACVSFAMAGTSTYYLLMMDDRWIEGKCLVEKVTWMDDLYDFASPLYDPDDISNDEATMVPGYLYDVMASYEKDSSNENPPKNDTDASSTSSASSKSYAFPSSIRNPVKRTNDTIPDSRYVRGESYDCSILVERLNVDSLTKDDQEEENSNDLHIYFGLAVVWKNESNIVDLRVTENNVKKALVVASWTGIVSILILIRIGKRYFDTVDDSATVDETYRQKMFNGEYEIDQ